MTKRAFSNSFDLVPPHVNTFKASTCSSDLQFRMVESEGVMNFAGITRKSMSISTGLEKFESPVRPMTLLSGRLRVPPKSLMK